MDLDIKPIRCFVRVAEELSFSKAAIKLNITQPTLSAQIRALENAMGFSLFTRSTREVRLTLKGSLLLKEAYGLLRESDRFKGVIAALNASDKHRLRIGAAFYTLDIPIRNQLIESFLDANPKTKVTIDTSWQSNLLDKLLEGSLDVVIAIATPISLKTYNKTKDLQQPTECLYPKSLSSLVVRRRPIELLIPTESALSKYDIIPQSALEGHQIASLSAQHGHPLIGPITNLIENSGGLPIVPPEAHGIGVEKYGRKHRLPAISLGWFVTSEETDDMVRRSIEDFKVTTELVILRRKGEHSLGAELFFRSARETLQQVE